MVKHVIRIISPGGPPLSVDHPAVACSGKYVVVYNPTILDKTSPIHCYLKLSDDWAKAARFDKVGEAMDYWRWANGVRPDGKPDRPLTAFTVEILKVNV